MDRGTSSPDFPGHLFDKGALFDKPEPLKGVRVLEVCSVVLGPPRATTWRNSAPR